MTRKPTLTSAEKLRTPFSGVLAYRVAALFATYCTGHRLTEWSGHHASKASGPSIARRIGQVF
jgi:hypothetical protein